MRELRRLTVLAVMAGATVMTPAGYGQTLPTPRPPDTSSATTSPAATPPPGPGAPDPAVPRTPAPTDAYVYIGWPNDGQTVRSTHFRVWLGTRNFGVAPAGTNRPNTGHHHLLIDTALPPLDEPIPNDKTHLHLGLGQTETVIDLPPGTHTLQLLMGDAEHVPHDPPVMSKKITIYVRPTEGAVANAH